MAFTGVFPASPDEPVPRGPVRMVRCGECGLAQLAHNYDLDVLYGPTYGYRSGLNGSMVRHLRELVADIERTNGLGPGDIVVDIGSNDGTLLNGYATEGLRRIGIDPTAEKFRAYYDERAEIRAQRFDRGLAEEIAAAGGARVVTSIAMFYDLPDPVGFAKDVASMLDDRGVWIIEQSYLPSMIEANAYDTICHEHLEYYRLADIVRIAMAADLTIQNVQFNHTNGGSFRVQLSKEWGYRRDQVWDILDKEHDSGFDTFEPFKKLADFTHCHKDFVRKHIESERLRGKTVLGYGASTKGNVLLQHCGIGPDLLPAIAEVNEDKFGKVTPGTRIPIVSEDEARAMKPDAFLVLPWHFRDGIVERERAFLEAGGQLIFPLPEVEAVRRLKVDVARAE